MKNANGRVDNFGTRSMRQNENGDDLLLVIIGGVRESAYDKRKAYVQHCGKLPFSSNRFFEKTEDGSNSGE